MILRLYNTTDNKNVINKTLTNEVSVEINLKADTDIVRPSLLLVDKDGVDFTEYNYAQIVEFDRYYHIEDIESVNNGLWYLTLECDVLESYKEDILNSRVSYYRNMRAGDYLNVQLDESVVKEFDRYESDKGFSDTDRSVILTTIGV